jgi:hypothetical protein
LNGKREYSFRWRVGYAGRDPGDFTDWQTETTPKLSLAIGDPGQVSVSVLVGNIDFQQVTGSVQVDLDYADVNAGVADEGTTVILNSSQQEQTYQRWIYVPRANPVRYRTHFFLKNGQEVDGAWQQTTSNQLPINEPPEIDKLSVNILPVGDWSNVVQTVVDVKYGDGDGLIADTFDLHGTDEFRTWTIVLKDRTKQNFQYRYLASFKDGSPPLSVDWVTATGSQTVPIAVRQNPEVDLLIVPQLVDFDVTPIVEVDLHYDDQPGNVHQSESLVFKAAGDQQTWKFPIKDPTKKAYRYTVTYNKHNGAPVVDPEQTTDNDKLVLQRLDTPQVYCLVVPKLVDFTMTPVVEVDVTYQDQAHQIDFSDTLVFTDPTPQDFTVEIGADSPKTYQLKVTYYLADGKIATRDPVTLGQNKVVVPRYVVTA